MKLSAPRATTMLSASDVPSSPKLAKKTPRRRSCSGGGGGGGGSGFSPSTSWKPVSVEELSPSWYQYGASYGLNTTDLLCLHSQVPWTMSPGRRDALAIRLAETLEQQEWVQCAILLAVFVRSELEPVILNENDYRGIEQLAQHASTSHRLDAPEAAGMTARLGRVLLDQLHRIANNLSIAPAAAADGRDGARA